MLDWLIMLKIIKKYINKTSFAQQKIFSKNFVAIHEIKPVLTPVLRFIINYNYIKRKFSDKLLFTDTDSLTYEIKIDDIYEDFYEDRYLFDFSNYPKDSKFYDPSGMNETSKMKDEFKGKINNEFAGLKSKIHSLTNVDGKENKTRKISINMLLKT